MSVPETFFTVNEELRLFGMSCLLGVFMGVVYDVFRTARLLLPHKGSLTAVEDIVYLAFYAAALLTFASGASRGEFRFYFVIGSIIGFVIYILTLGSIVTAIMRKLFFAVKGVFSVVFAPFKRCYMFLRKKTAVKFVGSSKFIVNSIKKIKSLLLKLPEMLYNKREIKMKERGDIGKKDKKKNERSVQRSAR